jgi:hypothetical protein
MTKILRTCLPLVAAVLLAMPAGSATITIINGDDPGEGFNDPTPMAPVPGNPGTTLGEQRLNVFRAAADRYAAILQSDVEIRILAYFDPMDCGVLGSSTRLAPARDFPGAPLANTWYQRPLADALSGTDRHPGLEDLRLRYNSNYDIPPPAGCDGGPWWYWISEPPEQPDPLNPRNVLLPVVLHEITHGLGFATYVDFTTGQMFGGFPDIYSTYIYDTTVGLHWPDMTNGQRFASGTNDQNVVFDGPETKVEADAFLTADNMNVIINEGPAAGTYDGQGALFGASYAQMDGLTLDMEIVNDGTGASTTDGCEPLVGFTPGRIAFIDRGTCQFGLKALHAEQAGAGGVVIADNQVSTPFKMAPGEDGRQVTIPVNYIVQAYGDAIRGTLPASTTFEVVDVNGMHSSGFPTLYAPTTIELGSTISHFDVFAGPNALMEPAINTDLFTDLDMTPGLLRDEGWTLGSGSFFEDGFESGDTTSWSNIVP